jgi:hypothetical protein
MICIGTRKSDLVHLNLSALLFSHGTVFFSHNISASASAGWLRPKACLAGE